MNPTEMLRRVDMPLTPYDFFAYIIPGGVFLLSAYLFELWARELDGMRELAHLHTPVWTALRVLRPSSGDWVLSLLFLLALVAVSYVSGHVIGSVSSLLIDRTLIAKGYGYPFAILLQIRPDAARENAVAGPFYRGLFFWVNALLCVLYLDWFLVGSRKLLGKLPIVRLTWWGILLVILVAVAAKVVASCRYAQQRTWRLKFAVSGIGRPIVGAGAWFITGPFAFIYDHMSEFFSRYLFTKHAFHENFRRKYRTLFRKTFDLDPDEADTNNFWFSSMFVQSRSKPLSAIAANWLHLYSFARNLSTAFYFLFTYGACWLLVHQQKILQWESYRVRILLLLPLGGFLLSLVMLLRYYYLYASYYTKFVFRAFVYLAQTGDGSPEPAYDLPGPAPSKPLGAGESAGPTLTTPRR